MPVGRKIQLHERPSASKPLSPDNIFEKQAGKPLSEDDLFEKKAIQVSSTSKKLRTMNHNLQPEMKRKLVFQDKENQESTNAPYVEASFSTEIQRPVETVKATELPQNKARSIAMAPPLVPITKAVGSPKVGPRHTPLTLDEKNRASAIATPIRKIMFHVERPINHDSITKVEGSVVNQEVSEEVEKPVVNQELNEEVEIPKVSIIKEEHPKQPKKLTESTFDVYDDFSGRPVIRRKISLDAKDVAAKLSSPKNNEAEPKKSPLERVTPLKRTTITPARGRKRTSLGSAGSKRSSIPPPVEPETLDTANTTETAPIEIVQSEPQPATPEIKETTIEIVEVKESPTVEAAKENVTEMTETAIDTTPEKPKGPEPLTIKVPPPPTLEDLESLDPELYIKLKSGSVKDDQSPFVSENDRVDIEALLADFTHPPLTKSLIPVSIIGEGTFSTVYKVIDRNFYECENSSWIQYSRQNPLDWLRLWRLVYNSTNNETESDDFVLIQAGQRVKHHKKQQSANDTLQSLLKGYFIEWATRGLDSLLPRGPVSEALLSSISPRALQAAMLRFRPFFIALKRINATSSPQRILDEMSFLRTLGGRDNVVPLINGYRCEDQIVVTFPYFYSEDFRDFLSNNATFNIVSIAKYMRALFISLAHLHAHGVIHRDVKPSNFLFSTENGGRAVLVDFGLAQNASHSTSSKPTHPSNMHVIRPSSAAAPSSSRQAEKERKKLLAVDHLINAMSANVDLSGVFDRSEKVGQLMNNLGPGYFQNDPRAAMKASRAGTRGFRAPEVLFKYANQTTALDMWSAGVILLTLLTRRYPFFQSSDDLDAILEIACIFGQQEMSEAARFYGRNWVCSVPSVPEKHITWPELCARLNPAFAPEIPPECYSLLAACLNLNADKRIRAEAALYHPFIQKYASRLD